MKRNEPMKRYTRLSPAPLSKRSKKRRDEIRANAASLDEYCSTRLRCFVCGISAHQLRDPFRRIDFHHLMGRFRKESHDPRNLIPLDGRLHRHIHSGGEFDDIYGDRLPELLPGHLLWCKREQEPELFDPEFLCWLRGWKGFPEKYEPCPLPAIYLIERSRNQ